MGRPGDLFSYSIDSKKTKAFHSCGGLFFINNKSERMQSFRTEIENPVVERDIIELERKIYEFKTGQIDEERFRTLRLARGVYGQRQLGVQMVRIKIPYGKLNSKQLERIAKVSDDYSTGKLHITTRQDIQIHHVSLDRTPELWSELEKDEITLREACGNTVRNISTSATSGIDPEEEFDVRPFADAVFRSFLRNPVCQEMGRKVKIAFSNSEKDTALTFMHDIGFIAQVKDNNKGFKVLLAGGLGSQSRQADILFDFLETKKIIPLITAILRVFDRYGERANRMKARLKFLVRDLGLETFSQFVHEEIKALESEEIVIEDYTYEINVPVAEKSAKLLPEDENEFNLWKKVNVIPQKQSGLFSIGIKVRLGDFTSEDARFIANLAKDFSGDELTLTIDQNLIIRHVPENQLERFFYALKERFLSEIGYSKTTDITACPGTDTCNLGIANSTSLAIVLEKVLFDEFPQYQENKDVFIKISGCMNSCGQHMIASIGFQGMSINLPDKRVIPAVQVLLGGGNTGNGKGVFADKVIKIPSKRAPEALRWVLNDFQNSEESEFLKYYNLKGEKYFYDLLKPLASIEKIDEHEFYDWGSEEKYRKEIGIGECAGVVIDLVSTLFIESEEKLFTAKETFDKELYADSMYHSYSSIINTSKALLLLNRIRTNSHATIIDLFNEEFIQKELLLLNGDFLELAKRISLNKPEAGTAENYIYDAMDFYKTAVSFRQKQLENEK